MTGFKTILVPVSDGAATAPLAGAFQLGADFSAHVTALHVRPDPTQAVPLMGEGMSGSMVEEMMDLAERQAATRATEARGVFDRERGHLSVALATEPPATPGATAEWLEVVGREEEVLAWRGRLHDLVVMARPRSGESLSLMALNAVLMESGKPLLLVPPSGAATIGRKIAIAWNGSAEAGRAVAFALPLLARAEGVTILSVAEDDRVGGAPAGALAASLAWHGIQAQVRTVAAGAHTGHQVLDECASAGADLLVMGAYTHSRLRQLILGGVTRHVLEHSDLPVLMSH